MGQSLKNFIIDVDGVLTDGQFHYTTDGKVAKIFGPDDADAILLAKPHINIVAVSGDKRGFPITKKRVEEDMGLPLYQVSTFERVEWIQEKFNLKESIYMGDGVFDAMVFD
ncbi:MAG: phosphatase, partial [bacterium]|nr:phosphatase [bacterium]